MNELDLILSNDTAIDDDGWALIAPFGEHPKSRMVRIDGALRQQKFIQVLDNAAADTLVSKENSLFGRLKRAIVGIPVYDGHPDLRDHAPETLANAGRKYQIGVVDQVRKAALGIEGHFVLSPEGATAVANGSKYPSALWLVQPNGTRGDATLATPFKLLSVGLTAHPNIAGVESLANNQQTENMHMREQIIAVLIGRGVELANEVTDSQLMTILANGDYPGHPFHGNQYAEASGGSSASNRSSRDANSATQAAMKSGSSEDHHAAAVAHKHAAAAANKAGNKALTLHHDTMAAMHTSMASSARHAHK
jgi:hypothetical protein